MAHTKFGVIYSVATGQIRRYFYPDDDSQLVGYPLLAGEGITQVSIGPYPNSAAWQTAVNNAVLAAAGMLPGNPRCCVIDGGGNITKVIMADPSIDSMAGMTLVNHAIADVGWTWTLGGGFVAPSPGILTSTHRLST